MVVLHLVCLAPLWQNRIFKLRHLYNKSNQSGLIHDQNVFVKLLQILQRYLQLLLFSNEPILENIVIHIVFRNYQKENHILLSAVLDSNQLVSAVSWTKALCRTQCFSFFFTWVDLSNQFTTVESVKWICFSYICKEHTVHCTVQQETLQA